MGSRRECCTTGGSVVIFLGILNWIVEIWLVGSTFFGMTDVLMFLNVRLKIFNVISHEAPQEYKMINNNIPVDGRDWHLEVKTSYIH